MNANTQIKGFKVKTQVKAGAIVNPGSGGRGRST